MLPRFQHEEDKVGGEEPISRQDAEEAREACDDSTVRRPVMDGGASQSGVAALMVSPRLRLMLRLEH